MIFFFRFIFLIIFITKNLVCYSNYCHYIRKSNLIFFFCFGIEVITSVALFSSFNVFLIFCFNSSVIFNKLSKCCNSVSSKTFSEQFFYNNYILTVKSIRELGKEIGSAKTLQWFEIQRGQTMSSEYWKKENHNALSASLKLMANLPW